MPVTRSEALFFVGGVVAGIAAAAAFPVVKRQLEGMKDAQAGESGIQGSEMGQRLAETVEQFIQKVPNMSEASASGMAAGVNAAKRMAEAVKKAASEGMESVSKSGQQAA